MLTITDMIIVLAIFLLAIGGSFCCGFLISKRIYSSKVKEPKEIEYQEPKQNILEKVIEYIDDNVFKSKQDGAIKNIKRVETIDGKYKDERNFF